MHGFQNFCIKITLFFIPIFHKLLEVLSYKYIVSYKEEILLYTLFCNLHSFKTYFFIMHSILFYGYVNIYLSNLLFLDILAAFWFLHFQQCFVEHHCAQPLQCYYLLKRHLWKLLHFIPQARKARKLNTTTTSNERKVKCL